MPQRKIRVVEASLQINVVPQADYHVLRRHDVNQRDTVGVEASGIFSKRVVLRDPDLHGNTAIGTTYRPVELN